MYVYIYIYICVYVHVYIHIFVYVYLHLPRCFFFISWAKTLLFMCWRCFLFAATFFPECLLVRMFLESSTDRFEASKSSPARVTHFPQFCAFEFGSPNKNIGNQQDIYLWSTVHKMSKAKTCLKAWLEILGTTVWFRCSLPGLERNGVICRQNRLNCRQNGVNRNNKNILSFKCVISRVHLYQWQSLYA